jgi:glycosyltransferase involved in cell wall biosynthesis
MQSPLSNVAVIIPAWQPDERLVELAQSLCGFPFAAIVIVNDGSSPEHEQIFEQAARITGVTVLRHAINCGQCRAVKTGMQFVFDHLPYIAGVVTADADGQHAVKDIVRIAEALTAGDAKLVLGVRSFGAEVPLRSRFGNILTQYVFRLLSGHRIQDTQTGLRGVPRQWIPEVQRVAGDRFEFAISLLARFLRQGIAVVEVPISTIYIDENRSSHFRPVRDSIRIYGTLLKFYLSRWIPFRSK